jgi:hypothetical protein
VLDAEDAAGCADHRAEADDLRHHGGEAGLEGESRDQQPDHGGDLVAQQRADADAERSEQGGDGEIAPQHVGVSGGVQRPLPAVGEDRVPASMIATVTASERTTPAIA